MIQDNPYSVDDIVREYASQKTAPEPSKPNRPKPEIPSFENPAPSFFDTAATPDTADTPNAADAPILQEADFPVTRTRTLVLSAPDEEGSHVTREIPFGQLPGQLVFAAYEDPDREAQRRLAAARKQKVRDFRLIRGGLKLTGEEEEDFPEEEPVSDEEDEGEIEDYTDESQIEAVREELAYRRRSDTACALISAVLACVLPVILLLTQTGAAVFSENLLLALQLSVLLGMTAIGYRQVWLGLKGLFTLRANAESPAAVLTLAAVLYAAANFFLHSADHALIISAVAGFALAAGAFGKMWCAARIARNFSFLCGKGAKYAAKAYEDPKVIARIMRTGKPNPKAVYFKRSNFLSGFLSASYGEDTADRAARWFVPVCLAVSLLCAAGFALAHPQSAGAGAAGCFMQTLCLSLPLWMFAAVQAPMTRLGRSVLRMGGMISGWQAAEAFGEGTDALLIDAGELFPAGTVKLHGIRTFSGARIDEAISDAAAVVLSAGGPLAPVFRRVVENTAILSPAEGIRYEQEMGLSGWVDGRRVLVGTRRLLDNHGVVLPPKSEEERFAKDGREVVYLSAGGDLCAMLVVGYSADPAAARAMDALKKEKIPLLVRTCDPSVTPEKLSRLFGGCAANTRVLSAEESREISDGYTEAQPAAPAMLCAGGRASGRMMGTAACRRLRKASKAVLAAAFAFGALGVIACVVYSAAGRLLPLSAIGAHTALAAIVSGLVSRIAAKNPKKKPAFPDGKTR